MMYAKQGTTKRRGRPPLDSGRKTRRWEVWFDAAEAAEIEARANDVRMAPVNLIRQLALAGAISVRHKRPRGASVLGLYKIVERLEALAKDGAPIPPDVLRAELVALQDAHSVCFGDMG
jgi:hypothetical protein